LDIVAFKREQDIDGVIVSRRGVGGVSQGKGFMNSARPLLSTQEIASEQWV